MAGTTTYYDVVTRYSFDTHGAGQNLVAMDHQMQHAAASSHAISHGLEKLAAIAIGAYGIHSIYEKSKEANLQMMNLQRSITGTHFAFTQWDSNISIIDRVRQSTAFAVDESEELENVARRLHLDLGPVATIYNSMAASAGKIGLSHEQTLGLVEKLSGATRVYGADAEMVASTVSRALETGGIRGVDNFAKMLRQKLNLKEEGKNLAPIEMLSRLQTGLSGTVEAAQMMGGGLSGTMADLHREGDVFIRAMTGPAFKQIMEMLHQWLEYSAKNREHVENMARTIASSLVTGLNMVKDITIFIHDHWKSMAMLYVGMKMPGMIAGAAGGMAGGMAGGISGDMGKGIGGATGAWGAILPMLLGSPESRRTVDTIMRDSLGTPIGKMTKEFVTPATTAGISMVAKLGVATIGLTAFAVGLQSFSEWGLKKQGESIGRIASGGSGTIEAALNAAIGMGGTDFKASAEQARILRQQLASAGLAGNHEGLKRALEESGIDVASQAQRFGLKRGREVTMGQGGAAYVESPYTVDQLATALERALDNATIKWNMLEGANWRMPGLIDVGKNELKKPPVNVNINRIEVTSEDPDRFAFDFVESLRDVAKNPNSALAALREG
jgi:hypothetical protein